MEIIGEIKNHENQTIVKVFRSVASHRLELFRIHKHIEYELAIIEDGTGIYRSNRIYNINPNDLFYFKSNELHCATNIFSDTMTLLNIYISPLYFKTLTHIGEDSENFGVNFVSLTFPENKLNDFMDNASIECVRNHIYKIISEFENKKPNFIFMVKTHLNAILIELSRCCSNKSTRYLYSRNTKLIFQTIDFIDNNYSGNLSLQSIAENVNLEKTYLSSLFKKVMGISVWDYVEMKRIEKALNLIRTTEENILNIALQSGFNNTANFNKVFKKHTGSMPKNFR